MSTNNTPLNQKTRFAPIKRKAELEGLPYTSVRDAVARGELAVMKLGANEKHQRAYVEQADWERWINSRKERA